MSRMWQFSYISRCKDWPNWMRSKDRNLRWPAGRQFSRNDLNKSCICSMMAKIARNGNHLPWTKRRHGDKELERIGSILYPLLPSRLINCFICSNWRRFMVTCDLKLPMLETSRGNYSKMRKITCLAVNFQNGRTRQLSNEMRGCTLNHCVYCHLQLGWYFCKILFPPAKKRIGWLCWPLLRIRHMIRRARAYWALLWIVVRHVMWFLGQN